MTDYGAMAGVNWSSLKHIHTSPLLYRWRLDHPQPTTDTFVRGGAIHCGVLEPHRFASRYAVYDDKRDDRVAAWRDWQAAHPGVQTFKSHELRNVIASTLAVHQHKTARRLLGSRRVENVDESLLLQNAEVLSPGWELRRYEVSGGRVEAPTTWVDPDTGLVCKGRFDFIRPTCVLDLKSTTDPEPIEFGKAAARYLYHGQLAWYHFGAIAARLIPKDAEPPYVVAVQSSEPYDVVCYQMNWMDLGAGRELCLRLMERLQTCIESDYWPGIADGLEQLQLPSWAPGLATEETY